MMADGSYAGGRLARRGLLKGAAAATAGTLLPMISVRPAEATPQAMQSAIDTVTRGAKLNAGRVRLDVPPLVENGNTVPCTITVDSPMSQSDYVKAVHVFNEKNPQANVVSAWLSPRSGKAEVSTRIRLSDTQTVVAIAEMSDGTFWTHRVNVIITLGACLEDQT